MTRIAYIEEYILVARNLSLTKAARQLNVTQPAVSKHMSALEKDLGVQLLSRDKQSIALTNAGKEFLEHAETIAATYALAKDRMKAISHSRQIEVKIGGLYHGAFTRRIVLEALGKLNSATFQFCDVDKNPLDALLERDIDVLVQTGAAELLEDERFRTVHLFDDGMMVALSAESPLAERERIAVKDLAAVTVLQPTGSNFLALNGTSLFSSFPHRKPVYAPTVFSFSMIELGESDALVLSKEIVESGFSPVGCILRPLDDASMSKYAAALADRSKGDLQGLCEAFEAASEHLADCR